MLLYGENHKFEIKKKMFDNYQITLWDDGSFKTKQLLLDK